MSDRKRVFNVGRWRVAVMRNGRYRTGLRVHRRDWFDFALPWVCISALRRNRRA